MSSVSSFVLSLVPLIYDRTLYLLVIYTISCSIIECLTLVRHLYPLSLILLPPHVSLESIPRTPSEWFFYWKLDSGFPPQSMSFKKGPSPLSSMVPGTMTT